jgi:hypothetical protein
MTGLKRIAAGCGFRESVDHARRQIPVLEICRAAKSFTEPSLDVKEAMASCQLTRQCGQAAGQA